MKKQTKFFYGYWIVICCFLCLLIWSGVGYYSFGIFFKFVEEEFGWGRGAIASAWMLFMLIQGLAGPFVGRITDRHGPKRVICGGAIITGLGFALLSLTQSLWYFYAIYILVSFGSVGMGIIPTSAVVSNWFSKWRGTALGISATGIGIGGLVLAPVIGAFLIPNFGWRLSYVAIGLFIWVLLIPVTLGVIKTRPEDIGLYPDGLQTPSPMEGTETPVQTLESWTLNKALTTSAFWLIATAFLTTNLSSTGVIQHQVMYFTDIGIPVATASAALGCVGLGSALGKFAFGWLSDRLEARYCAAISFALQASAIIIIMEMKSPLTVWIYSILMGLGVGGWAPLSAMLISLNFGLASFGTIYGMLMVIQHLGTGSGPFIAGHIYDLMHSYLWAFTSFLLLYAIAIPAILAVRHPKMKSLNPQSS